MAYWTVAIAQPNRERTALVHLERQGYRTYCPLTRRQRIKQGRKVEVQFPLFPRYLFVEIEDARWWSLRNTRGLASIIIDNATEQPVRVRDNVLDAVKRIEAELKEQREEPRFKRGQKVVMIDGPFAGHSAVYDGQSARDREFVLLELLGRATRVEVAATEIQ
jgi:transcriptional antiterminator RfaH